MTEQFWEDPCYVDKESFANWTDVLLISQELNQEFIRLRNLVTYIYNDVEYYTEDSKSYVHLFHFKFSMLLSIISMKRDYLTKYIPDDKDTDGSVSAAETIGLTILNEEDIDFETKFSHVTDVSSVLNLLFISDDLWHIMKLIKMTSSLCGSINLPSHIDMNSLDLFLKTNQKKIIIINFSYFKWTSKSKKIFYYLLYLNKRGKINNPIWLIVDAKDLQSQKHSSLKTALGSGIYDLFDICLGYDEEITRCIGVSYNKHWNMNALQNLKLNNFKHQTKVKSLEFPNVISHNKCACDESINEELLMKLSLRSVNTEGLISSYYCWRKEQADWTKVKITPNRLSLVYKIAENVNFLRSLYLKNDDKLDDSLDIVDGVTAIFFNELTIINDKSVSYSEKQLLRSYCVERVMSRMEIRPFYELLSSKCQLLLTN
jgi:hypothetical protein